MPASHARTSDGRELLQLKFMAATNASTQYTLSSLDRFRSSGSHPIHRRTATTTAMLKYRHAQVRVYDPAAMNSGDIAVAVLHSAICSPAGVDVQRLLRAGQRQMRH